MSAYKDSAYDEIVEIADQFIANAERGALPTETISRLIYRILQKKRPRTSYIVAKNKWLMHLALRLPSRWMDRIMWKRLKK